MKHFDTIIIGTGSAGLPAGMYASRYKLSNLIIGSLSGGALATSHQVENWPGVISAPGAEIMKNFRDHALHFGSEIVNDTVSSLEKNSETGEFIVKVNSGEEYQSKTLLLATGNSYRKLGIPGELELLGQGVSYCATCDGNFFKNLVVAMVGGGDAAITEALYLAQICKEVHILVRTNTLRAEQIWVDMAHQVPNISFHFGFQPQEILGGQFGVTGIQSTSGETLAVDGVFVAIGSDPDTKLVDHLGVEKDETGCIIVDKRQATNIPGLYAAGDVTTNSNKFKQTIMSAAEGCLAANSIHEDLLKAGHK